MRCKSCSHQKRGLWNTFKAHVQDPSGYGFLHNCQAQTAGRRAAAAAAGRLVMDLLQSDWEPLSHRELEQRLDQAVEDILEAELMSGVQGRSECVFTQDETMMPHTVPSQTPAPAGQTSGEPASENHQNSEIEENPAVQKLKWSHSQSRVAGRARLSLSHTVSLSLTLLSSRLSYRSVSSTFHLEKGNVHRIFFSFCHRVSALQAQIIRWPSGQEASDLLLPFSTRLGWNEKLEQKGLPKVLGVLGHTRIPIRPSASKQDSRRPRRRSHPDAWLNLELVCDAEGRFIHCSVSRGSQRHRGDALSQRLAQHPELLPPGACLLAGAGYALSERVLTPFRPARSPQEVLYNGEVETHLGRLEQAVSDLKERFGRLRRLDTGRSERADAVVLTCCVLQNTLLRSGYVTQGQEGNHTGAEEEEEEEEEGREEEEAGVRWRKAVANLLYSALESGAE
ncbi:uncharacterized protein Hap1MRO34_018437 isoform 2-T2 [Clarias gariepinus]